MSELEKIKNDIIEQLHALEFYNTEGLTYSELKVRLAICQLKDESSRGGV